MDIQEYVDEIKLQLTGGVLELEIDDPIIMKLINTSLREIQRYIDLTVLETMQFKSCIDLSPRKVNSVVKIYRAQTLNGLSTDIEDSSSSTTITTTSDPMYLAQWQALTNSGYGLANLSNYISNYIAFNQVQQIRNTISTDLAFRYDRNTNKLYVNVSQGNPTYITVEYVPRFDDVSEIYSDYWIDMILKMSIALTKITLGRIRTRFVQNNPLWTQDGEKMLEEGTAELKELRQELKDSSKLFYPID